MYAIQFVPEDDLPSGHDWLMVRTRGRVTLFINDAAVCPRVLEEAWAGYRKLEPRTVPEQREQVRALALRS